MRDSSGLSSTHSPRDGGHGVVMQLIVTSSQCCPGLHITPLHRPKQTQQLINISKFSNRIRVLNFYQPWDALGGI